MGQFIEICHNSPNWPIPCFPPRLSLSPPFSFFLVFTNSLQNTLSLFPLKMPSCTSCAPGNSRWSRSAAGPRVPCRDRPVDWLCTRRARGPCPAEDPGGPIRTNLDNFGGLWWRNFGTIREEQNHLAKRGIFGMSWGSKYGQFGQSGCDYPVYPEEDFAQFWKFIVDFWDNYMGAKSSAYHRKWPIERDMRISWVREYGWSN